MLQKSTIQLLRFHFSFFLMPVYWFALSQADTINTGNAVLVFVILHLVIYPSSNGYNSYMDRDTESIGGIKTPMKPTKELFYSSLVLDMLAIGLSFLVSLYFALAAITYIAASRAYSYRGIRLKQYPFIGYFTVIIFQGAVTFFMVIHGCSGDKTTDISLIDMLIASLLIGGFYPLTQVYQHKQDKEDGVTTLSMKLGYNGTFVFTAVIYTTAMLLLAYQLFSVSRQKEFFIVQLFFLPVLVYFFWWFHKVYHNQLAANFVNTMRMNLLASACTNAAFIVLFLMTRS
jgi:1,4-dihydroxy-2-naphthoate polyprenyltransferase